MARCAIIDASEVNEVTLQEFKDRNLSKEEIRKTCSLQNLKYKMDLHLNFIGFMKENKQDGFGHLSDNELSDNASKTKTYIAILEYLIDNYDQVEDTQ